MNSIWSERYKEIPLLESLCGDEKTDVLIVGGGMAGVLCAYQLRQKGIDCLLLEQDRICGKNTCNTTAKITAQHGAVYYSIMKRYGTDAAAAYYAINLRALNEYRALAETFPCDFEEKTAFLYSRGARQKLAQELSAYDTLHIPYTMKEHAPLPFPITGSLGMKNQAQFHPLKLIGGLLPHIRYYENTRVLDIQGNRAVTAHGTVTAKSIILATHYPMVNLPGLYFMKLVQHRSYVLGLDNAPDVGGMYIDEAENGYSFRNYEGFLLLGGGGHKTGEQGSGWDAVCSLARESYPNAREAYQWSAQDCMTLDGIPYIGQHHKGSRQLYVATGFNKWGMTGSMSAAITLTELIGIGSSRYQQLFSPDRHMAGRALMTNIGNAAKNLIRPGKRCSHLGCALNWNKQEKSWDCPCHGSRFDDRGQVVDNPAKRGISIESD